MTTTTASPRGRFALGERRASALTPYALTAPVLVFLAVFLAYPIVRGLFMSLTDTSLLAPTRGELIGIDNFTRLLAMPSTWSSIGTTVLYAAGSVVGALAMGMFAALVMNRPMRGRGIVRSIVTLPWAAPPIAVALIFVWMFNNQYGVVNFLLTRTGIAGGYLHWLDNQDLALLALLTVTIWMTFPISALIILAALQSVPADLYEASRVDGAGILSQFRYVTVPGIRPTLWVLALLLTIWALRRFDIIWVMTQGGPVGSTSTIVVQLYREAFRNQNLGLAAALGVIGLVVSVGVTILYFFVNRRVEAADGGAR